jgi:hypothetical protein
MSLELYFLTALLACVVPTAVVYPWMLLREERRRQETHTAQQWETVSGIVGSAVSVFSDAAKTWFGIHASMRHPREEKQAAPAAPVLAQPAQPAQPVQGNVN